MPKSMSTTGSNNLDSNINVSAQNPDKPSSMPNPLHNYPFLPPPQNLFAFPRGLGGQPPRFMPPFIPPSHIPSSAQTPMQDTSIPRLPIFGAPPPPVTILVPYPIVLPFPIPIPIPLPIEVFLKAAELKLKRDAKEQEPTITHHVDTGASNSGFAYSHVATPTADSVIVDSPDNSSDQPLDFTKAKDTEKQFQFYDESDDEENDIRDARALCVADLADEGPAINDDDPIDNSQQEPRLPKFKITRLHSRRTITKESDSSRPLRKRKRILDCDYMRLKDGDDRKRLA